MNRLLKDEILQKLDAHFAPDDFQRPKRSQEWRKAMSNGDVFKIHLNFGLAIVNPSLLYFSSRLGPLWRESGLHSADDPADLAQFGMTLSHLKGQIYDGETREIAGTIYADVVQLGLPYLERLRDLREVVRLLQSTNATFWPTIRRDTRAYSLLITLAEVWRNPRSIPFASCFAG